MECWVAEIKLRAARRIGEISKGLEKLKPGGEGGGSEIPTAGKFAKSQVLKKAGLSTSVAHRFEKIADIHEEIFEKIISESKEKN